MNRRARSFPAAVLGATVAITAIVAPGPHVGAAPATTCTATTGVTVIVDFGYFGGEIERGCAAGEPTTALAALHAAGFDTAGTAQYGDAFLCRVDGRPAPKTEACTVTPPAKRSWSFYHARATDSAWTYSSAGVLSYQPPAGTIIAFAFGNYAQPDVRPSAAIIGAPTTTTRSTSPTAPVAPTNQPGLAQSVPPITVPPTTPTATSTTVVKGAAAPSAATTGSAATSTLSTPSTSAPRRVVDRTATSASSEGSSGSPLPAVLAALLVALLGVGAAVTVRARRRRAA